MTMELNTQAPPTAHSEHLSYQLTDYQPETNRIQREKLDHGLDSDTNERYSVRFQEALGNSEECQQTNEQQGDMNMKRPSSLHSFR